MKIVRWKVILNTGCTEILVEVSYAIQNTTSKWQELDFRAQILSVWRTVHLEKRPNVETFIQLLRNRMTHIRSCQFYTGSEVRLIANIFFERKLTFKERNLEPHNFYYRLYYK